VCVSTFTCQKSGGHSAARDVVRPVEGCELLADAFAHVRDEAQQPELMRKCAERTNKKK
jgi:hypothetical protein